MNRAQSDGRNQILDWAEILMGLEDNSIEFRLELPETDRYIENPADYVDAAEYQSLLRNLAEAEGRRGAPLIVKSAMENLRTMEIKSEEERPTFAPCVRMLSMWVILPKRCLVGMATIGLALYSGLVPGTRALFAGLTCRRMI